jgi:hypothetical protein
MTEQGEILFMQTRVIRLAAERWGITVQKASRIFERYDLLKFIKDGYGIFHTEGDEVVLDEVEEVLKNKGVDVHEEVK